MNSSVEFDQGSVVRDDTFDEEQKAAIKLVNSQTRPVLTSQVSKDSTGYTDATGIDLLTFIKETLHKNPKDRQHILQLESVFRGFLEDLTSRAYQTPKLTSYDRMIVHRVAAFFGLDHNVTQDGQSVVVTKTGYAKAPSVHFDSLIEHDNFTEKPRRHSGGRFSTLHKSSEPVDPMRRTRSVDIPSGSVLQGHAVWCSPFAAASRPLNMAEASSKRRLHSLSSTNSEPTDFPEFSPMCPSGPYLSQAFSPSMLPFSQYSLPSNPMLVPQNAVFIAGSYYVPAADQPQQPLPGTFYN